TFANAPHRTDRAEFTADRNSKPTRNLASPIEPGMLLLRRLLALQHGLSAFVVCLTDCRVRMAGKHIPDHAPGADEGLSDSSAARHIGTRSHHRRRLRLLIDYLLAGLACRSG